MSTATTSPSQQLARRLASIPTVDIALLSGGRVADLGCGPGESTISIAVAYPETLVDGFDADRESIETARANARTARVTGRVAFHELDPTALRPPHLPTYDVVIAPDHLRDAAVRLAGAQGVVVSREA